MPKFSERSKLRLKWCDRRLQNIMNEAIEVYDFSVLCGHRNRAEQNAAYRKGVSRVKWPDSMHNKMPSMAVDVAPYPIDWEDRERFFYLAGVIMGIAAAQGVALRWGGDWDRDGEFGDQSFDDLGHFEVVE